MSTRFTILLLLLTALSSGCVSAPVLQPALPPSQTTSVVELASTPFFPQQQYHCGPSALASLLNFSGVQVDPQTLASRVYLPKKRGSLQIELMAATRYYQRMPYRVNPDLTSLLTEVGGGNPVLVLLDLGWRSRPVWHYAVVVGYDAAADKVILRSATDRRKVVSADNFIRAWGRADKWGLVVLRPGQLPVDAEEMRYLEVAASLHSAGALDAALQSFRIATIRWPASAMAQFGLGNALYAQGRLRQAESAYRSAVQLDPGMVVARNNLAHVLSERGCAHSARKQIAAVTVRNDEFPDDVMQALAQTRRKIEAQIGATTTVESSTCAIGGTRVESNI